MTAQDVTPNLSVIVPVYEQWSEIPGLLACLARQTVPTAAFEVILVDNGSARVAPPLDLPPNVCVVVCAEPGSYAARNRGAGEAGGDWLVFTDADCRPQPGWLSAFAAATTGPDAGDLLAGAVTNVAAGAVPNPWETYDIVKGIPQARYVARGYAVTANLAVSRHAFDAVGGFDPARFSGGDAAFCRAARAAGFSLSYRPAAEVRHPARDSWSALATKARRVRGGQMVAGTPWRYRLAGLVPPLPAIARFLHAPHPLRARLVASAVQLALWGVELAETVRLAFGARPERR